jgi:cell division protein FtsL
MYLICLFSLLICVVAKNTTRLEEIKSDLSRLELKIDNDKYQVKQIENAIKVLKSGIRFITIKSKHGTERKLRTHNIDEIEKEIIILNHGIKTDSEIVKYYNDFILNQTSTTLLNNDFILNQTSTTTTPTLLNNDFILNQTSTTTPTLLNNSETSYSPTIFVHAILQSSPKPTTSTTLRSSPKPTTLPKSLILPTLINISRLLNTIKPIGTNYNENKKPSLTTTIKPSEEKMESIENTFLYVLLIIILVFIIAVCISK